MAYCTHCGALRTAGAFCTVCGAAQPPMTAPLVAAPPPEAYTNVSAPIPFPAPAPKGGTGLQAGCMTDDGPAEFYILNQPDYPLMLSWKLGSGSQLQVIKITYPVEPQPRKTETKPSAIEEQLKEKKKVDIYGIYFDFGSDHLKPESTPVLEEIAGVLTSKPEWKLTVNGHTDNVGGDVYNLDLSKRRAAAVKLARLRVITSLPTVFRRTVLEHPVLSIPTKRSPAAPAIGGSNSLGNRSIISYIRRVK